MSDPSNAALAAHLRQYEGSSDQGERTRSESSCWEGERDAHVDVENDYSSSRDDVTEPSLLASSWPGRGRGINEVNLVRVLEFIACAPLLYRFPYDNCGPNAENIAKSITHPVSFVPLELCHEVHLICRKCGSWKRVGVIRTDHSPSHRPIRAYHALLNLARPWPTGGIDSTQS